MAVLVYPSCNLWKGLFFATETWTQPFSEAWLWGEALSLAVLPSRHCGMHSLYLVWDIREAPSSQPSPYHQVLIRWPGVGKWLKADETVFATTLRTCVTGILRVPFLPGVSWNPPFFLLTLILGLDFLIYHLIFLTGFQDWGRVRFSKSWQSPLKKALNDDPAIVILVNCILLGRTMSLGPLAIASYQFFPP